MSDNLNNLLKKIYNNPNFHVPKTQNYKNISKEISDFSKLSKLETQEGSFLLSNKKERVFFPL